MQKTRAEIVAEVKTGAGSMLLLILSLASFIVFLWIVTVIVRLIAGLAV